MSPIWVGCAGPQRSLTQHMGGQAVCPMGTPEATALASDSTRTDTHRHPAEWTERTKSSARLARPEPSSVMRRHVRRQSTARAQGRARAQPHEQPAADGSCARVSKGRTPSDTRRLGSGARPPKECGRARQLMRTERVPQALAWGTERTGRLSSHPREPKMHQDIKHEFAGGGGGLPAKPRVAAALARHLFIRSAAAAAAAAAAAPAPAPGAPPPRLLQRLHAAPTRAPAAAAAPPRAAACAPQSPPAVG